MIINSAVGDMTDETNQAQAYAWIGLAYNVASILGPAIGYVVSGGFYCEWVERLLCWCDRGTFAKPEETFPNTLGTIGLFKAYPYLCPCVICALVAFTGLVCCALFFREVSHFNMLFALLRFEGRC